MVPNRRLVLLLAAQADCTVKTARRALVDGVDIIKGANLRDRLRESIHSLAPVVQLGTGADAQAGQDAKAGNEEAS